MTNLHSLNYANSIKSIFGFPSSFSFSSSLPFLPFLPPFFLFLSPFLSPSLSLSPKTPISHPSSLFSSILFLFFSILFFFSIPSSFSHLLPFPKPHLSTPLGPRLINGRGPISPLPSSPLGKCLLKIFFYIFLIYLKFIYYFNISK